MSVEKFNLQLAFKEWARPRGYDLTQTSNGDFAHLEARCAWLGYEAAHGPDGCKPQGQQLYARIKKTSQYAHQADYLFPVRVASPPYGDYVVHGGPGGVYERRDVDFFVLVDDLTMQLT